MNHSELSNGWHIKKLKELADITRGGSPRPIEQYITKGEGYNWLRIGDVPRNGKYISKVSAKIKPEGLSKTTLVHKGDFILSNSMSYGRPYITMIDTCIHDGWLALRNLNTQLIDRNYLYYLLLHPITQYKFSSMSAGSGVQNLKKETVNEIEVRIPSVDEQKRIVGLVESWDDYLEKLDDKILAKNNIKLGLLQNLLVDGTNRDWNTFDLDDICEIRKGAGLSKEKLTPSGQRECILYGELYTKYSEVIDSVVSRTEETSGVFSKAGDLLIPASTTTSHLDLAIASSIKKDNILLGGDINILRPKHEGVYDSDFLAYYLTHAKKHELARLAQGITIVHLYAKDFRKMKLTIPPLEEQKKIVKILKTATEEISVLMKKREHVSEQKRFLTNNLVSGKIRTPENLTMPAKEVQYA